MRVEALLAKLRALHHAEAVLLVDDGEAEAGHLHAVFEERVGADDDVGAAVGGVAADLLLLACGERAGEQKHAERAPEPWRREYADRARVTSSATEETRQRAVVLLGEDFGRRHQGRLVAGTDRREHRREGHHGLAATDVTLEEAEHRVGAAQVALDFVEAALLGASERERERLEERCTLRIERERRCVVRPAAIPRGA